MDQDDLVQRILHFLLASSESDAQIAEKKKNMSASRRKSLDVLAAFSEEAARPSPTLFNLRDLALLGLQSTNRQTILATLRLLTVVLQRHSSFAKFLIRTVPGQPAKQRTVGALNAELEHLLTMATSIMEEPTLDESFGNYLKDASWILESRLCIAPRESAETPPLEIRQDDPLVIELLGCLETFFSNSVIVNLALTEALMSIASSHLMALDGWLLVDPTKYTYPRVDSAMEGNDTTDILDQIQSVYREPSWASADAPALTAVLSRLVEQVQEWRKNVPDFDILVAARRGLLHEDDEPSSNTDRIPETPAKRPSNRPAPNTPRTPQLGSSPGTPRGRRDLRNLTSPKRSTIGSPLREPTTFHSPPPPDSPEDRSAVADELRKRLATPFFPNDGGSKSDQPVETDSEESPPSDQAATDTETDRTTSDNERNPKSGSATLGHVLTNVVILYEFLLEISAVVQARGTLFEEASFHDAGLSALDGV